MQIDRFLASQSWLILILFSTIGITSGCTPTFSWTSYYFRVNWFLALLLYFFWLTAGLYCVCAAIEILSSNTSTASTATMMDIATLSPVDCDINEQYSTIWRLVAYVEALVSSKKHFRCYAKWEINQNAKYMLNRKAERTYVQHVSNLTGTVFCAKSIYRYMFITHWNVHNVSLNFGLSQIHSSW